MKRKTLAEMQSQCDAFNAMFKPGDKIRVLRIEGEPNSEIVRTISRFGAEILSDHTPVVYVSDGGGCYALSHVLGAAAK